MAWTIHIDPVVNCAFIKRYGVFDTDEGREAFTNLLNHTDRKGDTNLLHDFRDAPIPSDVTYASMSDAFERNTQIYFSKLDKGKAAIVVEDSQSYAKVHQYLVSGRLEKTPVERKAFRDIKKALAWLDIPEDYEINYPAPDETT